MAESSALHAAREGAFLQLAPPPCVGVPDRLLDVAGRPFGPPLAKLTPWRHHLLLGYASPFVVGGRCTPAQLLQALWLCSPGFSAGSRWAFRWYRLRWAWFVERSLVAAVAAFDDWLGSPFVLQPRAPRLVSPDTPTGIPLADHHWLADRMLMGRRLGLDPVATLHLPYTVLWPMLGLTLGGSRDSDQPRFNRARDQQAKAYLKSKRERAQ